MKVLVVDDEHDVRLLFEQKFRREIRSGEMDFSFAYSGQEALDYLRNAAQGAVLILSDINMPGMSGLELLKRIKADSPVPPPLVMMITAYGDQQNRETAAQLGADDFLTKPVDFNELKTKLKSVG
ncbi:MAG: response regulator [Chitinophagaceae bacterium]|nr:response regulator [Chitinophagaceae bacterium]MCZ2397227.1 response regulator [Chitinophagales bacterium]